MTKIKTVGHVLSFYNHRHIGNDGVAIPKNYRHILRNLRAHFDKIPVEDVLSHIHTYADKRLAGEIGKCPAQNNTIVLELQILRAALNYCYDRNVLPPTVVTKFVFKMPVRRIKTKAFFLTREETYKLLDAALWTTPQTDIEAIKTLPEKFTRIYMFILLGLDTAARYTTITNMKWSQLDFDKRRINLKWKKHNLQTNKRTPIIAMSERLYHVLKKHRKNNPDDIYVLGHNGSIRKSFSKAVKRAGLPEEVTPHTLRHTFATLALQKGITPFQVAQVMGDNVQTVIATYGHHCPNYTHEAVNSMA